MAILQSLKDNWDHYSNQIKILIFGENNSRLDKIINRYYSYRPEKRKRVKIYGGITIIALFVFAVGYYLYGITSLQSRLNFATNSYVKIQEFKPSFTLVQTEYTKLSADLYAENKAENLIPSIQEAGTRFNVQIGSFAAGSPVITDLPATSVLKSDFKKAKIEFQINGISVKHLTKFLNELHALPNKFILTKLEIKQVEGNKLYFNSNITLEAYVPTGASPLKPKSKG